MHPTPKDYLMPFRLGPKEKRALNLLKTKSTEKFNKNKYRGK